MTDRRFKIGVVAPGSRIEPEIAEKVTQAVACLFQDRAPEIYFHPQCFLSSGHFAGNDTTRCDAFVEIANDESFDAVWFARGGYGSCRLIDHALPKLAGGVLFKH